MKHTITYNDLYNIDQDLTNIIRQHPSLKLLLAGQIQLFYQVCTSHLDRMNKGFADIQEKYIKKDAEGKFSSVEENGKREWDYKDSYSDISAARILSRDEVRTRFNEECTKFFSQQITIPI